MRKKDENKGARGPQKPDLYVFCWDDAHHSFEDPGETASIVCYDAGFPIEEAAGALRLGSQWSPEDDSYRFVTTIPLGMVRWWRKVRWSAAEPRRGVDKKAPIW